MKSVNNEQLKEVIFDIMSDNNITFRQFALAFFESRIKNKESFYKTLELLEQDVKKLKVQDSMDLHPSLFEDME